MPILPVLALAVPFLQGQRESALEGVAALRAQGPPALERLLERYDALPEGAEKAELERTIDAVAAQRYATFSRLYWYTDLEAAEAAALASGKPILSLRMLGRLDEDLSCANSRLFRVVLYANRELSAFLRENFVLHWSSERPAPRLTIDFGDGRRIETTIAGNSAHFVLDADGRPIDALPGLYSPIAFRRELEAVLPLAREFPTLGEEVRASRLREYHSECNAATASRWSADSPARAIPIPTTADLIEAEHLTVTKMAVEVPAVVRAGLGGLPRHSVFGGVIPVRHLEEAALDGSSRALLARLAPTDWQARPHPLDSKGIAAAAAILEALVAADTERNELGLHIRVHEGFASDRQPRTFQALDDLVYRELFRTPIDDPWLGFSTPLIFTGLPGDGIRE
jgi:hypothetical protein